MNVEIEKRDDFDAMIERKTISIQNIDFFDVSIDVKNEIKTNEISMIDFDWIINDVNINVNSFDDKNITKNVNIAIIVFDVNFANVVILTNFVFDIKKNVSDANVAIDVNVTNFANFFWWWFSIW